jgi:hypothetical protein
MLNTNAATNVSMAAKLLWRMLKKEESIHEEKRDKRRTPLEHAPSTIPFWIYS